MSIFDAINVAESAMAVHRYRSEVASENIANVNTPGYHRKEVDLRATSFTSALNGARAGTGNDQSSSGGMFTGGSIDASRGAVRVAGTRTVGGTDYDERQQALMATTDMLRAKSAFELNVKSATLLKSMALSSLEIGRGS